MIDPNDSAFAVPAFKTIHGEFCDPQYGLTKREYFAALAMQAFITVYGPAPVSTASGREEVSRQAWNVADAMIAGGDV